MCSTEAVIDQRSTLVHCKTVKLFQYLLVCEICKRWKNKVCSFVLRDQDRTETEKVLKELM